MSIEEFINNLKDIKDITSYLNENKNVLNFPNNQISLKEFIETAIKLNRFDLVIPFFNDEQKYHFILDIDDIESLKKSIDFNLKSLITSFKPQLFTKELFDSHGEKIIKIFKDELIGTYYTDIDFLFKNSDFFNFCLEHEYLNIISKFNHSLFTKDIIDKYGHLILKAMKGFVPYPIRHNPDLLKFVLSNKYRNYYAFFVPKLFTNEIIDDNLSELFTYLEENNNYLPDSLYENPYFFKKCLENKKKKLYFSFYENLYTEDIINEYGSDFLEVIENSLNGNPPPVLKYNLPISKYALKSTYNDLSLMFIFPENILNDDDLINLYSKKLNLTPKELKDKLSYLYERNNKIFKTLIPKTLKYLDIKFVEALAIYPDFQGVLLKLKSKTVKVLAKIYNILNIKDYDFTTIIYHIFENIQNKEDLIEKLDIDNLTEEELKNLIYILKKKITFYEINSNKDLDDSSIIKQEDDYFKEITLKIQNNSINLEDLRSALLEKKFGLDIKEARFIHERYGLYQNGNDIKIRKSTICILNEIGEILNSNSLDELKFLYITSDRIRSDFYTTIALEVAIRSEYSKAYSKTLYKPKENDKINNNHKLQFENPFIYNRLTNAKYNDKKLEFYLLNDDFNLQVHVLGGYRGIDRPDNFKDDWNRPIIDNHGIATSYIGNSLILTTEINHPILGFADYEAGALLGISNKTLYSDSFMSNYSLSIANPFAFYPPDRLLDSTNYGHNEILIERRDYRDNENFKRQPSYIVYIVDDINNPTNFDEDNPLYQETIQAASDFNIPIIILDRLQYAKRETIICQELEKEFFTKKDTDSLRTLIFRFWNNVRSCSKNHDAKDAEYKNYFTDNDANQLVTRIYNFILELNNEDLKNNFIAFLRRVNYPVENIGIIIDYLNDIKSTPKIPKEREENIARFYYKSESTIQEKIKKDIENHVSLDEIIRKINNHEYEEKENETKR